MAEPAVSKSPLDLFVAGAKQGWNLAVNNLIPNILMAFVVIEILKYTGVLDLIGKFAGPAMALWGLPGETLVIICTGMLSQGGAIGMTISLHGSGVLSVTDVAVMTPGIMIVGGLVQYIGRCLGTAAANKRYWGWQIGITLINSCIAMTLARILVSLFYSPAV